MEDPLNQIKEIMEEIEEDLPPKEEFTESQELSKTPVGSKKLVVKKSKK